jgi:hypothetical protein
LFIASENSSQIDINKIKYPVWPFTLKDVFSLFSKGFKILKIKVAPFYVKPCFFIWMRKKKKLSEKQSYKELRKLIEWIETPEI